MSNPSEDEPAPGIDIPAQPSVPVSTGLQRWLDGLKKRPLPVKIAALLSWITISYIALILLIESLHSKPDGKTESGPIPTLSFPLELYRDLHETIGKPLDIGLLAFCLLGFWFLFSPLLPRRAKPEELENNVTRKKVGPGPALKVVPNDFRREIQTIHRSSEQPQDDIPEYIRRMITRFVDIRTLQPRGILRSVVIIFHSDVEAYRHLLRTPDCLRSLERLRALPSNVFDNDACTEMLVEEGYEEAFDQLGMPRSELIPCLIERIEGEIKDTSQRFTPTVDDGSVSTGITWYIEHLVTRFVDIRTLEPAGVLRSVLILLHSNIESYRHLLTSPECMSSLERLRGMALDIFDNEHCNEILETDKYKKLFHELGLSRAELIPNLIDRIERRDSRV